MAKSRVGSVILKIFGFLGLIALFIAFLVFIYGLFLYMFEGEKLSFEDFSITRIFSKEEKKENEENKVQEDTNVDKEKNSEEGNLKDELAVSFYDDYIVINNI